MEVTQEARFGDSLAARDVVAKYALFADHGEVGEILGLFKPDGRFEVGGQVLFSGREEICSGIEAMRAAGQAGPTSGKRHLLGAAGIKFSGPDVAHVTAYFLFVTTGAEPTIALSGTFEDELHRIGDQWLIAVHAIAV